MTNDKVLWLLGGLLGAAALLSAALVVEGPKHVEQEAIAMFETEQRLEAQHLAGLVGGELLALLRRLELPAVLSDATLRRAEDEADLQRALAAVTHSDDAELGISLFVHDEHGHILAVSPDAPHPHGEHFREHTHHVEPAGHQIGICEMCLEKAGEVSLSVKLSETRYLAANVNAHQLAGEIFERNIEGRNTYVELVNAAGAPLYSTSQPAGGEPHERISASASIDEANWSVNVSSPRSAIAPEVDRSARHLLTMNGALLALILAALAGLVVTNRRRNRAPLLWPPNRSDGVSPLHRDASYPRTLVAHIAGLAVTEALATNDSTLDY